MRTEEERPVSYYVIGSCCVTIAASFASQMYDQDTTNFFDAAELILKKCVFAEKCRNPFS